MGRSLLHRQIGCGRVHSIHFEHHGLSARGDAGGDFDIHLIQAGETWGEAAELDGGRLSGNRHFRQSQGVGQGRSGGRLSGGGLVVDWAESVGVELHNLTALRGMGG
jgi:hypothetical protein